jgi:hypothetical protein
MVKLLKLKCLSAERIENFIDIRADRRSAKDRGKRRAGREIIDVSPISE